MGEEIAVENGRISEFMGLVTLTLTLDRFILHTVMHHSSTSTYIPNFNQIEETFLDGHLFVCHISKNRMSIFIKFSVRTGGRTDI